MERETRFELATPSLAILRVRCKLLTSLLNLVAACKLLTIRRSREPPIRESAAILDQNS